MNSINDLKKKLSFNKVIVVPVESSNLSTFAYNPNNNTLTILFSRGNIYKYFNVNKEVIYDLLEIKLKGRSIGSAFRDKIMNKYSFSRLDKYGKVQYSK